MSKQQRIHDVTAERLEALQEDINKVRVNAGMKKLTVPDLIESIVESFQSQREMKKDF